MKYFYMKYVNIEFLVEELHEMDLSERERHHLATLIDLSMSNAILDEILSNLSEIDKKAFIHLLQEDPESGYLMKFLNEKVENIEEKIKKAADDLAKQMHEDIKQSRRIK